MPWVRCWRHYTGCSKVVVALRRWHFEGLVTSGWVAISNGWFEVIATASVLASSAFPCVIFTFAMFQSEIGSTIWLEYHDKCFYVLLNYTDIISCGKNRLDGRLSVMLFNLPCRPSSLVFYIVTLQEASEENGNGIQMWQCQHLSIKRDRWVIAGLLHRLTLKG